MSQLELTFRAMGSTIRLIIGEPTDRELPAPSAAAEDARRWLLDYDARMSRFRPDSELCKLNADPREHVPASALLRATVSAGIWAAEHSGGLVDPTLLAAIEQVGYDHSMAEAIPAPLVDALASAPARRPAAPAAAAVWRQIRVDHEARMIHRPAGIRFDSGGAGKGLSADALAHRLTGYSRVAIDCGGDVRIVGPASRTEPFDIEIEHPLTGATAHRFALGDGAVATSGLSTRIWRTPDGGFAHHLLDPSTLSPAWTGLIQTTAIGTSALEAETLSKTALLSGPERAREILAPLGGALVHDDGEVELVGALRFEEVAA
jgi:thiamine biosynthesis lipoprotein